MNIALEQTKEYVNGILHRSYGDAFIRGNNGEFVIICCYSQIANNASDVYISRLLAVMFVLRR
jgi:U6 snRNA-associated Sm-like protein LSm6